MECVRTLLVCVACVAVGVGGFNVDVENFVQHTGKPGSMFGFSVAQHQDRGVSWVLVGAPNAQTRQPGVVRGGAVYRCDVSRDDAYHEVQFDITGNNNNSHGVQIDRKSEQWFGATVSSSGADGVIVACAPRYVWFGTSGDRRDPVGTCYVTKNSFREFSEYSPCRTRNWGYHRQGHCQVGLGAAIAKESDRLYLGAVGAWYWQGQLHSVPSDAMLKFLPPEREDFGAPGQIFSQSLSARPEFYQTREGPAQDDDSYLGYSVVAGDFDGSGQPGVAVGMPKGHFLEGKVVLYTWDLKNSQNITGEQIGGYFGYSLCSADVDGDGLDDLIIGAPMFTAETNNNEMKYETGRIYVVYQETEEKFKYLDTRDGTNSKGRFGLSLAGLGDINKDGYGDFAVGAPYDGPSERGAVYIYHGSKAGVMEKHAQVIFAEDIRPDMATFGFSLAGGTDLDNNEYPDLVVGAYESEMAFVLRSRPVIKMNITLDFQIDSKVVSLKERNCTTRDKNRVTCFALRGCLDYSGVGVDRSLDFEIQFLLDSKKSRDIRLFFLSHEGRYSQNYSVVLEKGRQFCKTEIVYIKSSIRDKLTPLEAELRYSLRSEAGRGSSGSRRVGRSLSPILDQNMAAVQKDSVNIEKNCGKDNICIPDLKLIARPSVDQYLLGSGERFELDVVVENNGEDAFEAVYSVQLPPGMNYTRMKRIDVWEQEISVQCSGPSAANNYTLKCDIGNPLPKRKMVHFKVIMTPFHRRGMKSRYEFYMEVNTTNPENKNSTTDNTQTMSIPIWVQTEHTVVGNSYPSDIPYNMSQHRSANVTREADIGPQVVHIYSIKNQGPSDIVEAEAFFVWPSHTQEDDELLYLLEQPQTNGPVRCEKVATANALKVTLDPRNQKNYLELHGITTDSSYNSGVTVSQSSSSSSSSSSRTTSTSFSSSSEGSYVHSSSGGRYDGSHVTGGRGGSGSSGEGSYVHSSSGGRYDGSHATGGRGGSGSSGEGSYVHSSSGDSNAASSGGSGSGGDGDRYDRNHIAGSRGGSGSGVEGDRYDRNHIAGSRGGSGSGVDGDRYDRNYIAGNRGGGTLTAESEERHSSSGSSGSVHTSSSSSSSSHNSSGTQGGGQGYSYAYNRTEEHGRQGGGGRGQGSTVTDQRGGGGRVATTSSQGGRESSGNGGRGSDHDGRVSEHDSRFSQSSRGQASHGSGVYDERHSQTGGRTYTHSHIPEEEGAYLGSRGRGTGGLTKLEQDYSSFGSHASQGARDRDLEREREEWRRAQANRAEWRANQGNRGSTSGGGYGREETRHYSQGGGGDYDAHVRGHQQGGEYGSSSSSSRTYSQGGSGDYSAGGTRLSNHGGGGVVHEEYGYLGGAGRLGGQGERTHHESRNFTSTYSEDGGAPRHFSNYSFSTYNSGGRNASGSWQSGDADADASNEHSGSHETVSQTTRRNRYGTARESNLQRHGTEGASHDTGGGSGAERRNWSTEERRGLAVYNWTSPVDGFGLHGGGSRTEGESSRSGSTQWEEEYSSSGSEEPGLRRTHSRRDSKVVVGEDGDSVGAGRTTSHTSSSTTHLGGGLHQSKDISAINDVDSRFQVYNRFERSVRDLARRSDKNKLEETGLRHRRSADEDQDVWDREPSDEGYVGESVARQASNSELDKILDCAVPKCSRMRCVVGPLKKDDEVFIGLRYRVWVRTLEKVGWNRAAKLSTLMTARVTELPHVGEPFEMKLKTTEIPMEVFPTDVPVRPDIVPLWVVVLSACAGAVILLLLIFLLYKCGFFKRNRPSDSPEKEPLNRNGHYNSGDEAL